MTIALVRPVRPLPWFAASWAALFALVHLYWAAGGRVGVFASAPSITGRTWFLVYDLVAAVALLGAAGVATVVGSARLSPRAERRIRVLMTAGAVLVLIRGLVGVVQDVVSLLLGPPTDGYGVMYDIWFVVAGVSFFLLARRYLSPSRRLQ